MSPVKKRIKENKDHYVFADSSYSSASHSPLDHQSQYYAAAGNVSRDNLSNAIIISDDTPPLHGRNHHQQQQHNHNQHHIVPEVITILDSDDDTPPAEDQVKSETNSSSNSSSSVGITIKPDATPVSSAASAAANVTATASLNTSGCPSVMPITPVMLLRQDGYSAQSTPSRSHAASCVTVNGDSDEDYQRTPIKQQRTPVATCSSSSTKQVLQRYSGSRLM